MSTPLFPIALSSQLDDSGVERIHAAARNPTVHPIYVPTKPVYVLMAGTPNLLRSRDGGETWPDLIDSGGSASDISALYLDATGNRIHRDEPISGRTSTDGMSFGTITGDLSGTGFPIWHMYTGDEWLRRSAGGMRASTDGITYVSRTIPSLGIPSTNGKSFAKLGNTIIFHYLVGSTNYLCVSTDNGLTWSSFNFGQTITQLVATATKFLAFTGASGSVFESTTGVSGSWTAATSTSSANYVRMAAYDADSNTLVVVNGAGAVYISYNEGATWLGPIHPFSGFVDFVSVRGLVFAFGNFILVHRNSSGQSVIYTSPDGLEWTLRYTTSAFLGCVSPLGP